MFWRYPELRKQLSSGVSRTSLRTCSSNGIYGISSHNERTFGHGGRVEIRVVEGDIASVEADAIITAINSDKIWFGLIDEVIYRHDGVQFHRQVAERRHLVDGQAIVAKRREDSSSRYKHVVFVVDDLMRPLNHIVYCGLSAANGEGFKRVSVPMIRMGRMQGKEEDRFEVISELGKAIKLFRADTYSCKIETVTVVVYEDPSTAVFLRKEFGLQK